MREYFLNIADYKIVIRPSSRKGEIFLTEKYLNFRNVETEATDLLINVHFASFILPQGSEKVFEAPFVKETGGEYQIISNDFWSVYRNKTEIYVKAGVALQGESRTSFIRLSLTSREWDIYTGTEETECDPLAYPLDGLLLYYLTVLHGDIFVHASAINNSGRGYLFSGVSGKGKSTLASIWKQAGADIIHDDRIIIRHRDGKYWLHNTPVYENEVPSVAPLSRIFLIGHGNENDLFPLSGASAVSQVLANCIQQNWSPEIIARLMGSISIMCSSVPCFRLDFKPDRSVVDFLLDYE